MLFFALLQLSAQKLELLAQSGQCVDVLSRPTVAKSPALFEFVQGMQLSGDFEAVKKDWGPCHKHLTGH